MTAVCDGAGDGDSTAGGVAVCATAVADGVRSDDARLNDDDCPMSDDVHLMSDDVRLMNCAPNDEFHFRFSE